MINMIESSFLQHSPTARFHAGKLLCGITAVLVFIVSGMDECASSNPAGYNVVTEHTYPPIRTTRTWHIGGVGDEDHEVGFTVKIKAKSGTSFLLPPNGSADTGEPDETNHVRYVYSCAGQEVEVSIIDIVEVPGKQHETVIVTNETGWPTWGFPLMVKYENGDTWHQVYARRPLLRSVSRYALETRSGGTPVDNGDILGFCNIFNVTLPLRLLTFGANYADRHNYTPVAGVEVRPVYRWSDGTAWYPSDWSATDSEGRVSFTIGDGTGHVPSRDILGNAPLYAKVFKAGCGEKQLTYANLAGFTGTVHVTVVNKDGYPVPGALVDLWGGYGGAEPTARDFYVLTDQNGQASTPFPADAEELDSVAINITAFPAMDIEWNLTQVVDNPSRIVKGHGTPLYISPRVAVNQYYPYTLALNDVRFQVYEINDPETVLLEKSQSGFRKDDAYTDSEKYRGRHRVYIEVDPDWFTSKHLGIRAVYQDNDTGRRSDRATLGLAVDSQTLPATLYEPRKQKVRFGFVPLRVGAWSASIGSYNPAHLDRQMKYLRQVFPAPVDFCLWEPIVIARRPGYLYGMENDESYLWHIFNTMNKWQKFNKSTSSKQGDDILVGLVPPKFLGAGGLQQSGYYGMNWEFLGAVHNAVLLDLSGANKHVTIHEFIHTLGLVDVYPSDITGWRPISANGHSGAIGINNVFSEGMFYWTYFGHPSEAIMYDQTQSPWPTDEEYDALLDYAVKAVEPTAAITQNTSAETAVAALLLAGGAVNTRDANIRQTFLDSPLPFTAPPDRGGVIQDNPYVVQLVDAAGTVLDRGFFNDSAYNDVYKASFLLSLPQQDNIRAIEIGRHTAGNLTELWARYNCSANPPTVNLTGPANATLTGDFSVSWNASDPDGDELVSTLLISDDGGVSWRILVSDIFHQTSSGSFSYNVNSADFPAGTAYRFQVIVSDGLRFTTATSATQHTMDGYDPLPKLNLPATEIVVNVLTGATEAVAVLPLNNIGGSTLTVTIDANDIPEWISAGLTQREIHLFPGEYHRELIPLIPPVGLTAGELATKLILTSNDPHAPVEEVTLKLVCWDQLPDPQMAGLITTPEFLSTGSWPLNTLVGIRALANAARDDLEATVVIASIDTGIVVTNASMNSCPGWPGSYLFDWNPVESDVEPGTYGARITLRDPTSGFIHVNNGFDVTFVLAPEPQDPDPYNPDDPDDPDPEFGPSVRVNGRSGTVTVNQGQPVTITFTMQAGGYSGINADWWLVVMPANYHSWFYLNTLMQLIDFPAGNLPAIQPAYQGPLTDITQPLTVLTGIYPPRGVYSIHFAVDTMDGILNYPDGPILVDSATLVVE